MKRQFIIISLLLLWCCCACEDDDKSDVGGGNEISFSAKIADYIAGKGGYMFGGGNVVGIYAVQYSDNGTAGVLETENNYATNVKYRQSAEGLASDRPILWGSSPKLDIYAYYPWQRVSEPVETINFEVYGRQDSLTQGIWGYDASDFLWTKQTVDANNPVNLEFQHRMSQIVVKVKNGEGASEMLEGSVVKILGHNVSATIDMKTGVVKAVTPAVVKEVIAQLQEPGEDYDVVARMVTVPQTVSAGTQMIQVISPAGNNYKYTLPENVEFSAGGSREIEIVVIPGGKIEVTIGEITGWKEDATPEDGVASLVKKYKVGDKYVYNGVEGMVYKVDETGEHGMVLYLWDAYKTTWTGLLDEPVNTSYDDGIANMDAIREKDPTFKDYPTLKWCEELNKDGVTDWYIPSHNELNELFEIFAKDRIVAGWNTDFKLNKTVQSMGGLRIYGPHLSSTQINFYEMKGWKLHPTEKPYVEEIDYWTSDEMTARAVRKF